MTVTIGHHLANVGHRLSLLGRLLAPGISVIVIRHHPTGRAHAGWAFDLATGSGTDRSRNVGAGTLAVLLAVRATHTGEHLAAWAGTRAGPWGTP
ncbi:MAG TPA: hypothetical protein VMW47_01300 [Verrucomicrobiae bacterium]|nr:hypothetical protein [Verrucomicrobiae bacterium]